MKQGAEEADPFEESDPFGGATGTDGVTGTFFDKKLTNFHQDFVHFGMFLMFFTHFVSNRYRHRGRRRNSGSDWRADWTGSRRRFRFLVLLLLSIINISISFEHNISTQTSYVLVNITILNIQSERKHDRSPY